MRYLLRKLLFAGVFAIILVVLFCMNFANSIDAILDEIDDTKDLTTSSVVSLFSRIDTAINENFVGRIAMVEGYAQVQNLLGKKEIYQFRYAKDDLGYLHDTEFYRAETGLAETYVTRLKIMQEDVAAKGTKLLVVIPPSKYQEGVTKAESALPIANPEREVSEIMYYCKQMGIDAIDFNTYFPNASLDYEDCFYKTEHYWSIPAAYMASREIVAWMNKAGGRALDPEGYWLSPSSFEWLVYPSAMLGSDGRKCGEAYAGREDFTALWPRHTCQFERLRYLTDGREVLRGTTYETLIDRTVVEEHSGLPGRSAYASYLGDEYAHETITNLDTPDAVRVLCIRDSYLSPVITFIAPLCGVIDSVWSEHEDSYYGLANTLQGETYDYIIFEVDPYRIEDEAFDFNVRKANTRLEEQRREKEQKKLEQGAEAEEGEEV